MTTSKDDLLFEEELQRELDLRFSRSVPAVAEIYGQSTLITDAQLVAGEIAAVTEALRAESEREDA